MKEFKIEFRRGNAGGGNQLRQPYLKNFVNKNMIKKFKNVDHIHFWLLFRKLSKFKRKNL